MVPDPTADRVAVGNTCPSSVMEKVAWSVQPFGAVTSTVYCPSEIPPIESVVAPLGMLLVEFVDPLVNAVPLALLPLYHAKV